LAGSGGGCGNSRGNCTLCQAFTAMSRSDYVNGWESLLHGSEVNVKFLSVLFYNKLVKRCKTFLECRQVGFIDPVLPVRTVLGFGEEYSQ
jgi:hypothetical protein